MLFPFLWKRSVIEKYKFITVRGGRPFALEISFSIWIWTKFRNWLRIASIYLSLILNCTLFGFTRKCHFYILRIILILLIVNLPLNLRIAQTASEVSYHKTGDTFVVSNTKHVLNIRFCILILNYGFLFLFCILSFLFACFELFVSFTLRKT